MLLGAHAASVVGDALLPVALAFAVLDLTGSPSDLGLVLLSNLVPRIVFMLAGGVWADRLPRQWLMVGSHFSRFATQGLQGVLLISGHASILSLCVLQVLRGTGSAFFRPAASGVLPSIVDREDLQSANALMWMAASIGGILGPALAGVLVATVGPGWAIMGDAVSFLVAGTLLLGLKPKDVGVARSHPRFFADLAAGWHEVRSRTWVWASICHFSVFQLVYLSSLTVLGPLVAKRSLGGAPAWALIATGAGVGTLIGNMVALRMRPSRPLVTAFSLTFATIPSLVLLAVAAPAPAIAATEIVAGAAIGLASALWETTLQQGVPAAALSRVSSYDWMGSIALKPLGLALVGPLADAIGVRATLLGAAALIAFITSVILTLPSIQRRTGGGSPTPVGGVAPAA